MSTFLVVAAIFLSSHLLVSLMCKGSFFGWGDLPQTHSKVRIHQKWYRQSRHQELQFDQRKCALNRWVTLVLACSGLLSNRIHHFSSDSDSFFFLETKANFKIGTEKIFFFFFCGGQGSLHGRKQEFFIAGFFQCLSLSSLPLSFLFFFCFFFLLPSRIS